MIESISQDKIKKYQEFLEKSYWELLEAVFLLCGITKFSIFTRVFEYEKILNISSFASTPWRFLDENEPEPPKEVVDFLVEKFIYYITERKIKSYSFRFEHMERVFKKSHYLNNHTYFIRPQDALSIAVIQGFQLPLELQIASQIYQLPSNNRFTKGQINDLKRYAFSQAFCWRHFGKSKSEVCRLLCEFYGDKRFDFLNKVNYENSKRGNGSRPRLFIDKMMPKRQGEIKEVPGIVKADDEETRVDFQKLNIALNTIKDLLFFWDEKENRINQSEDFFEHPLIRFYRNSVGFQREHIMKFCIKEALYELDMSIGELLRKA